MRCVGCPNPLGYDSICHTLTDVGYDLICQGRGAYLWCEGMALGNVAKVREEAMDDRGTRATRTAKLLPSTNMTTGTVKLAVGDDGDAYLVDFVLHSFLPPKIVPPPFSSFAAEGGNLTVLGVRDAQTDLDVPDDEETQIEEQHRDEIHELALAEITFEAIRASEIIASN